MHGFLEIDEFQEMLGKMLRKWLKIVFFKNPGLEKRTSHGIAS